MLATSLDGFDTLAARFEVLPATLQAVVRAKAADLAERLRAHIVDDKLSGQVLRSKTGALIEKFDTGEYPADWHLHREEERYAGFVLRFADEIAPEQAQPGDLVLFKFGRAFSHGAILVAPGVVVHAVRKDRCVVLGDLDRDIDLIDRPRRWFSFWRRRYGR